MKSFVQILIFCFLFGVAHAALPDRIPTNRADAQIYALTRATTVSRSAQADPVGSIRLLDLNYNDIPVMDRFPIQQPASAERLLSAVKGDKFKFVLPRQDTVMNLTYEVFDALGNRSMTSFTQVKPVPTGNPASPWRYSDNRVYFWLDDTFEIELEANFMSIEFFDPNTGERRRQFILPKDVGGKTVFVIPTWWFDDPAYQNGITYVYSDEEMRQYDNRSGGLAGIDPITFVASPTVYNHFILVDPDTASLQQFIAVQSYGNTIENPSFEFKPTGSANTTKMMQLNVRTTEGTVAKGVRVTEQNEDGTRTTYDMSLSQTPNYGVGSIMVKAGKTYYFRLFWPDYITDLAARG